MPTRAWTVDIAKQTPKTPVFVHPVFSLPNVPGRRVEVISLKDAKVTDATEVQKVLAVIARAVDRQYKRTKKWTKPK